ncbi:hypothetical protein Pan216_02270 [Planctomycetes bacterium Pan216]|uniref:DUF952 domain-containing protein n=1 Tax=Kolteria novifilia TaxID=2527975 RepID=A0A518AXE6_9BACT|nr:hypothetical protein Pan216_02270 [Planctomycetes bacterium Pan216]
MTIYHYCWRSEWEQGKDDTHYRHASLTSEGFIHGSRTGDQLERVAREFFGGEPTEDLFLLTLDEEKLEPKVVDEDPGIGELFPHLYGPINLSAVTKIESVPRDAGQWIIPPLDD